MAQAIATDSGTLPVPVAQAVPLGRLAACVQALDPAARALLDLSLRRGLRDEAIAAIVLEDPFRLAWGRAPAATLARVGRARVHEDVVPVTALPPEPRPTAGDQHEHGPLRRAVDVLARERALVRLRASHHLERVHLAARVRDLDAGAVPDLR